MIPQSVIFTIFLAAIATRAAVLGKRIGLHLCMFIELYTKRSLP